MSEKTGTKFSEEKADGDAARLEAVLNTIIDGVMTIDDHGLIQTFNPSATRIFGYTPEEVIGKNIKMLMPEPYHSGHDGYIKNYLESGQGKVIGIGREVEAKRKDGTIFPLDLSVSQVNLGGQKIFSGIVRDISERKKIEQKLFESEQRYDLAVKGMGVGLWDWNILAGTIYWSPKFMEIVGITDPSYAPTLDKFKSMLHPEDREYTIRMLEGHLQKDNIYDVEYRLCRMDGNYVWIRACGLAVWNEKGAPVRMVGSVSEIGDRKKAEEEMMRSNEELERFAYIASHDLQEPLRMVANFTSLLKEEYGASLDQQAVEYMHFIIDAARRMQALVSDLLEYSRIGSEGAGLSSVDGTSHTELALANLKESIGDTKALVTLGDLPTIYANPVRFVSLMQNLIGNALKYKAKDRAPAICIQAEDRGTEWLFSVSDNGIGMKEEYLEQIFIIFKRLHGKKEYKGTGIGLAVCKKIVESLDGKIWATSQLGKGSTFYFTVPKKKPERKAA